MAPQRLRRRRPSTTGRTGSAAREEATPAAGRAGSAARAPGRSPAGHLPVLIGVARPVRRPPGAGRGPGPRRARPRWPAPRSAARVRRRGCPAAAGRFGAAMRCRSRRRTRLRTTAEPTPRDTTKPTRVAGRPLLGIRVARGTIEVHGKQAGPAAAAPPYGRGELGALAQPGRCRQHDAQAESRVRPLVRRAPRIERPARVRMRRRNPWVLARRRLFGWKVRLLTRRLLCFRYFRLSVRSGAGCFPAPGLGWAGTTALEHRRLRGHPWNATVPTTAVTGHVWWDGGQSEYRQRSTEPSTTRPSHGTGARHGRSNQPGLPGPSRSNRHARPDKKVLPVVDNRLLPDPPGC